jgi:FSR family fosmidomycin resistance protein-like MFS transporter
MPPASTFVEIQSPSPVAESQRFQTGRVATVSAGHAVHDTYTAFLPSLLPIFIENLALSNTAAGLLTVCLRAPSLLQPFIGHLVDRHNVWILFALAPAVSAVMMSLLGTAPAYGFLVVFLLVAGLSSACLHAVGPVVAGHLSGRSLGRGMGFWMVGGELGRTLGPIVVVSAVHLMTLRGTPWLMIAGIATSALLYVQLRDIAPRPTTAGQGLPWGQALRAMGPLLVPLAGVLTARAFMASVLTTYLPTFLIAEGADLWVAGASLSLLEGAGVLSALLGGVISDRVGRRWVLFVSTLTTPLLMFLFLAVTGWLRFPLLLMLGLTALSVTPVVMAMVQESYPENRALANGAYMAADVAIRSVVVLILGALGDWLGLRWAFVISAIVPLLGLPLILLLPEKRP